MVYVNNLALMITQRHKRRCSYKCPLEQIFFLVLQNPSLNELKSRSILSAHNICAAFNFLQHCNFTHNILFLVEESLSKFSDGGEIGFVRFTQTHNATFNLNRHKSGR